MRWYNKVLSKFGDRRIMTHAEYWAQVQRDMKRRNIIVIEKREWELLRDIAGMANILCRRGRYHPLADNAENRELLRRMELAVATYKIVEDNLTQNTPPSTNVREEMHLIEVGE